MRGAKFPLFGLSRHRLGTDGEGVTTLAAAYGCPLRCAYCLNPGSWRAGARVHKVTASQLYELVAADDLYFQATGGGVTFGGGEPLAHAEFIREFRALCEDRWRITAETSLNVPEEALRTAMDCVDEFLVDIKDLNPDIYRRYTGGEIAQVLDNLALLIEGAGAERATVRVPHIPGYNTDEDVARSIARLKEMGVTRIDEFAYVVRDKAGE